MIAIQQKRTDLRPLLDEINKVDLEDAPRAWEVYKDALKEKERVDLPAQQEAEGVVSKVVSTTGSVFKSLLGAGPMKKQYSYGTSIGQIENACRQIREGIKNDYERFLKAEKKMMEEQKMMIKKHQEDLKNSDLKLIDYIMGNVPQPGETA